ncbi:MAG: SDR family oxidoreductase [Arenicellaceae bacterium]|nr:SDR family oxidoreductase [Arenicellaceae bacterium]
MSELPISPSFSLAGKRAVVTGAGRGIGLAAASALAAAGSKVTLLARTENEISDAAKQINARGDDATFRTLDVSDITAVADFFNSQSAFDIVVNNAGTNRPKPMLDVSEDDFESVLDLNLKSVFFVTQAAAAKMVEQNTKGSFIHISSQMGHVGGPNRSLYCASKWGLEGLNKSVALDLAQHSIRSNTIAPTFIDTPLTKPFFEDKTFREGVLAKIKLGRLGKVEDLMGAVVFLASDASALMTGTSVVIDGGWTTD